MTTGNLALQIRTGWHACEPGKQEQTCWDPTCLPYDWCKSSDGFLFSLVASTWATVSIKHKHILRTNNQKTWWGFKFLSFFFFFQHYITSMPEACGSVTCTLGEDRTAGRPASAALAVVRWPSLSLQQQQIPAGDVADCWPRTQQWRLWTQHFMGVRLWCDI